MTAVAVTAGVGTATSASAADSSITATSLDGRNTITMSLVGGVLKWSVKRNGTTVVDTSILGLRLSNGTTLGTSAVITNYQHWHVSNTWTRRTAATPPSPTPTRRCAGTSGTRSA